MALLSRVFRRKGKDTMGSPFEDAMEEAKRQAGELQGTAEASSGDTAEESPPETTQHEGMIQAAVADFERWLRSHLGGGAAPSGITVHTDVTTHNVPAVIAPQGLPFTRNVTTHDVPAVVAPPAAPVEVAAEAPLEGVTVTHEPPPSTTAPGQAPQAPAETEEALAAPITSLGGEGIAALTGQAQAEPEEPTEPISVTHE